MPRVVVVGSGAAGLAAALAASHRGADVTVLEADALLGGTSAISGGVVWAPANRLQLAAGIEDTAEAALAYLSGLATGDVDCELMAAFLADAPRVMAQIADRTPLRWSLLTGWPDYHSELPSGSEGGRSIWPEPLTLPAAVAARVRRPVELGGHDTISAENGPSNDGPINDGTVFRGPVRGHALIGALVVALLADGVELRTGTRVSALSTDDGAVTGVLADDEALPGRVVLATGGFQHDAGLATTFLPVPTVAPLGTPGCRGDGLRMAMAAGAELGNMAEGWWMPALHVPGEVLDGRSYFRSLHSERAQPGSIMVDGHGRRFVDEAQNYGDVGRAMQRAGPCWLVFDAGYRARYQVGPLRPADPDPAWLVRADDLDALADAISLPRTDLRMTVERFNDGAARGEDPDFGRGAFPYDRWVGDPRADHPTLAPLVTPPFYALSIRPGCLGTKGGPRTDDRGRVLTPGRVPVPGLYAAGNAAASPFGTATAAGGATLGPALVFGTRAGEAAATDRSPSS